MINKQRAILSAENYAKKHGYKDVKLIDEDFKSEEVPVSSYLFEFDRNIEFYLEYVGLPLYIIVDKVTGEAYEVRTK